MWSLYSVAVISWLIILIGMVATALLFVVANANVGKIIETSKSVICIKWKRIAYYKYFYGVNICL